MLGLKDPKISSKHAQIIKNEAGQLLLVDLGSTNGIKVDGKRVKQIVLTPGKQFQVGQTQVRVESLEAAPPALPNENVPEVEEILEPEIEVPPPEWPEYFQEFIADTRSKVKDKAKPLDPLPQMLQLKFLRGPQIDTVWSLGYGPRHIGRGSLDFPLYDEAAPELAFRVRAKGEQIQLETPHSKLVRLNDKFVSTEELTDGDLISIGSSLIQVSIKEM